MTSPNVASPGGGSPWRSLRGARWRRGFAAAVALAACGGAFALYRERRPEFSPAVRGERLAVEAGCFACHSTAEDARRGNFRQLASGQWRAKPIPTLWENGVDRADELTDWIANGVPEAKAAAHRKLFIRMPAYRSHFDAGQIDDIAAWILAENLRRAHASDGGDARTDGAAKVGADGAAGESRPTDPGWLRRAGDRLSRRHGCYQCHGELGQGGVRNPAAFKGYIPGFFGDDFLALTAGGDRAEIRHWLDHGRGRAIETGATGRLAKYFGDAQAIAMPPYRDRLTAAEKDTLVDYLLLVHRDGPLTAAGIERVARQLDTPAADAR